MSRTAKTKKRFPPAEATTPIRITPATLSQKRWFGLVSLILIPLLLLLTAEGFLRLIGYGYPTAFFKKGQTSAGGATVENRDFGRRFFPAGLVRYPQPLTLPTPKPPNTLRIFVLGESAAMGDPDLKFGLPRMLEVLLRERFPNRQIEVINSAMVAINSNVILPIARDCAAQQGDLWVVYMGNNEVIGPFGSASIFGAQAPPLAVVRTGLWLKTTKLGQLLDALLQRLRQGGHALPEWNGMEMMSNQQIAHDSSATRRIYQHFERNLKDLLRAGAGAGVPIILCTVATNLKDCAPFASLHRAGISGEELNEWQKAYDAGRAWQNEGKWQDAKLAYEHAAQIDGEFAELDFRRGECCQWLGQNSEAGELFRHAREKDALQFRADGRINEIVRRCGREFADQGVHVVDADQMFSDNSPHGLTGREFFYEHVHLTPEGNYLLAQAVAQSGAEALRLQANSGWPRMDECFGLLGLTDWNRYDAFNVIYDRIHGAPFASQADHARQLDFINRQLQRYKIATKPAELRQQVGVVARLVSRYPHDPDLRWNLAGMLQNAGDAPGAEDQWRALMNLQPQSSLPIFNLARLLDTTDRQNEAFTLYADCLQLDPDSYEARFALGSLCLRTGRLPEAIRQFRSAMKRRPGAIEARLACAEALARSHDTPGAEKQLQEILRLDPQNDEARQRLADLHHA